MGVDFQMFELDEHGKSTLGFNTRSRRIYLYVDALSARNWRCLRRNLCMKLTEIGTADRIVPMIISLGRYVVQHDVLHETRFHKQDVIYKLMYGSFLQPIQVHLGVKGLNGDPVKRGVQKHENLLLLVAIGARRHRFACFLKIVGEAGCIPGSATANRRVELLKIDELYREFCVAQETSDDEPTRIVGLFLKYMDGYLRGYYAAKHSNFWLLEQEGHDFMPGYKITGKNNYVTEGCHRIDKTYGRDVSGDNGLSDEELEWTRLNRFFTMTEGFNSLSLDEMNELLNLWNKEMVTSPDFEKVCEHSSYVMFHRSCQLNCFGVGNRRSSRTSNVGDVSRLIEFFERANIFPRNTDVKRTMHSNFFWKLVSRPKDIGSDLDKKKEEGRVRPGEEEMFNIICRNEDEKNDYQEFEDDVAGDDDENISIVSSCVDSCASGEAFEPEEEWESLNETGRNSKISEALKKSGNAQKRNMNINITKDFYEVAGKKAM